MEKQSFFFQWDIPRVSLSLTVRTWDIKLLVGYVHSIKDITYSSVLHYISYNHPALELKELIQIIYFNSCLLFSSFIVCEHLIISTFLPPRNHPISVLPEPMEADWKYMFYEYFFHFLKFPIWAVLNGYTDHMACLYLIG